MSSLGTQGTIGYALPEAGYAVGAVGQSHRAIGQPLWAVGQPPVVYAVLLGNRRCPWASPG